MITFDRQCKSINAYYFKMITLTILNKQVLCMQQQDFGPATKEEVLTEPARGFSVLALTWGRAPGCKVCLV
jgi:hypothetical protein